jgi:hypothetical protein
MFNANSGQEMDSSDGEQPMKFTIGEMGAVAAIEDAVVGMKIGEDVVCFVEANDEDIHPVPEGRNNSLVFDIPAEQLPGGVVEGPVISIGEEKRPGTVWLDWATIRFRFYQHCATYTGSFCVIGPALSSPAHGLIYLTMG